MKLLNTLVIAGLMSGAALADYTEELNWTFELEAGGRISLENINGNVEVTGQPGNTVEITAFKKAAWEHREKWPDAAEVVLKCSEMDDNLASKDTQKEMEAVVDGLTAICDSIGMRLHKFSGNCKIPGIETAQDKVVELSNKEEHPESSK